MDCHRISAVYHFHDEYPVRGSEREKLITDICGVSIYGMSGHVLITCHPHNNNITQVRPTQSLTQSTIATFLFLAVMALAANATLLK